jgi:hypothetical protein
LRNARAFVIFFYEMEQILEGRWRMKQKILPEITTPEDQNTSIKKTKEVDFYKDEYWEFCDNCGTRLFIRKCKLICPNCGFFHSCSEP